METKPALNVAVLQVLNENNYLDWSVRVKTYLVAQDLWDIVEASIELSTLESKAAFKAWSKKNAMALHVIHMSCGPDSFSLIREISSARIAWYILAETYNTKRPDPSSTTKPGEVNDGDVAEEVGVAASLKTSSTYSSSLENLAGRSEQQWEHVDFYKIVKSGDWNATKAFLDQHPDAITAKITIAGETALHIAAKSGHVHMVEELVKLMSEENLEIQDTSGYTALAEATFGGNCRIAECLLQKNKKLISIPTKRNHIPVVLAIRNRHLVLTRYLYSLTPLNDLMPEKGDDGATLFSEAIYIRALDIALDLVQRCPHLTLARDRYNHSPLYALACMPNAFPSGNQLVFWKRWIYSGIHILANATNEIGLNIQKPAEIQSNVENVIGQGIHIQSARSTNEIRLNIQKPAENQSNDENVIAPGIKHLYEMKLPHFQFHELLKHMSLQISISNIEQRTRGCVKGAIFRAIKEGNFEFIFGIVKANPDLVWSRDGGGGNIFSVAVLYRRPKIFSLIYNLEEKDSFLSYIQDNSDNYILHMAGKLEASTPLNRIPGAALQMQRELQWFKEVESIVHPKVQVQTNSDGLTPRELFTKNHKDMVRDGEKWMKDTATSCTVVGALIVTIMFAAAFTVPGGNDQNKGFPIFLDEKLFMLFIVSDALSLFSSSTSVLMFLGILTSRYAEEDFLKSLPTKMIIGLSTLFFSIAAMMIAFSAALLLMLRGQSWIFIPVICLASVPITLFVLLQFPILVDMVVSTYGPGIFDRKMKRWV